MLLQSECVCLTVCLWECHCMTHVSGVLCLCVCVRMCIHTHTHKHTHIHICLYFFKILELRYISDYAMCWTRNLGGGGWLFCHGQEIFFYINKNPTRCNSMQKIFIYCKATLHVSGVTAPIIRSTKNCNCSLRYRS